MSLALTHKVAALTAGKHQAGGIRPIAPILSHVTDQRTRHRLLSASLPHPASTGLPGRLQPRVVLRPAPASSAGQWSLSSSPQEGHAYEPQQPAKDTDHDTLASEHHHGRPLQLLDNSLYSFFYRVMLRVKGILRKVLLRNINRRIVRRVAARATIGIPILGFYFLMNRAKADYKRVLAERKNNHMVAAYLFLAALVADLADITCQMITILAISYNNHGMGLASIAAIQPFTDKFAMPFACTSFICGFIGELVTVAREEALELAERHHQQQLAAQAALSAASMGSGGTLSTLADVVMPAAMTNGEGGGFGSGASSNNIVAMPGGSAALNLRGLQGAAAAAAAIGAAGYGANGNGGSGEDGAATTATMSVSELAIYGLEVTQQLAPLSDPNHPPSLSSM